MPAEVPNVVLSIHPENADAILDGDKRWEYRRVAPAVEPTYRAVLYATAPVQAAVGACWVVADVDGLPAAVVVRTVDETPHDPDDVLDYLRGCGTAHALRVVGPRRFDSPVGRATLEAAGVEPVQNFRYLPDIRPELAEQPGVVV